MQSQEIVPIFQHYPEDATLFHTKRGEWWKEAYTAELQTTVYDAITALNLDKPWNEIHDHPVQEALANSIWSTVLACNGPQLDASTLLSLNKERFGSGYVEQTDGSHFTSNHLSISAMVKPIDDVNDGDIGVTMIHHIPTFATDVQGKPTIGDISPITLTKQEDIFVLSLITPQGNVWQKKLEVLPAAVFSTQSIGKGMEAEPLKNIASPCVSTFQVTILRPTCQEHCTMCTVTKGNGEVSDAYKGKVSETLDVLIDHAANSGHAFQQSLSAGTISSGDGGFSTAHEWALTMIEEKIAVAEMKYGHVVPVQLQLEMVLPPDKNTWKPVIQKIQHYTHDLGWHISLAVNMEILHDGWEGMFLQGAAKGSSTVADHIAFASLLKEETAGMVQMNSLVMFGLKPKMMDYGTYLAADMFVLKQLIAAGIKPDYQPVKIESGTEIEAYPPPNPVFLLVQDLALKQMLAKAKMPWSPGCVGACNACDQSAETKTLLSVAKKNGVVISELVLPILSKLGSYYTQSFTEVFV